MKITETQRIEAWTSLGDPKPSWETFKRMMPMFENNALVVRTIWLRKNSGTTLTIKKL